MCQEQEFIGMHFFCQLQKTAATVCANNSLQGSSAAIKEEGKKEKKKKKSTDVNNAG